MIYIVIGVVLFILALFERGNWHATKGAASLRMLVQFLLFIFFSVFIGLRDEVGGDWDAYDEIYKLIGSTDYPSYLSITDPGYAFVNKVISKLGLTVHYVNFICAAVFSYAVIKVSFRFPRPLFSISMAYGYLIPVVSMGLTRQSVSVGLGMLAIIFFCEKKYFRVASLSLAAISFHTSGIFIAFICALALNKTSTWKFTIAFLSCAAFIFSDGYQFATAIYDNYQSAEHKSSGAIIRTGFLFFSAVVYFTTTRNRMLNEEYRNIFDVLSFFSFLIFVVSFEPSFSTFADRFSHYLVPLILLAPVMMSSDWSTAKLTFSAASLLLTYNATFVVWLYKSEYAQYWIPYKNFFFN